MAKVLLCHWCWGWDDPSFPIVLLWVLLELMWSCSQAGRMDL